MLRDVGMSQKNTDIDVMGHSPKPETLSSDHASDHPAPQGGEAPKRHGPPRLTIVGIGASAGGLEALKAFFEHLDPDTGLAFVVIQHLDAAHKSLLAEILQQSTKMAVIQVVDGQRVEANHVYVIPPGFDLALVRNTLLLFPPSATAKVRLPIDFFLRSLAEDARELSVAIILSGAGSDGALGVKAIRERGGLVMVQDPATARFESMPHHAIATNMVDVTLPPDQLAVQLAALIQRDHATAARLGAAREAEPFQAVRRILGLLRDQTGHDFSLYKKSTITRRIERRMALEQLKTFSEYAHYLQRNPDEVSALFRDLLIGVTAFFRDSEAFDTLEREVMPELVANHARSEPIRVWVAGCSTGEEAYSIGILIREQFDLIGQEFDVQIFATDIDEQAIDVARLGVYPENIALDVPAARLDRFFNHEHQHYRVNKVIRDMVVFAQQSIIKDPPFSRIDLITCRNLLIYLEPELQRKLFPLFHYALRSGGYLFLGSSETLGNFGHLFATVDRRHKLFRRIAANVGIHERPIFKLPAKVENSNRGGDVVPDKVSLRILVERQLLDAYTPVCVIINEQHLVLYTHRPAGKYLELPTGDANLNILSMAREGLRLPLTSAIRSAAATGQEARVDHVQMPDGDDRQRLNVIVRPIGDAQAVQKLLLVIFEALPAAPPSAAPQDGEVDQRDSHILELERELRATKDYLQTTVEELQTSNEELKTVNEDLQSANEELQSTMEEMDTSREELQSVNEELATVNSELEGKIDELIQSNRDLDNLLSNVNVGIIFLDRQLRIQRYTPAATRLINLIPGDTGRPIEHLATNMVDSNLIEATRQVLATLVPYQQEVRTRDGRWYWMAVGPYRVADNAVEGVVATFTEITKQKRLQQDFDALTDHVSDQTTTNHAYQHLSGLLAALTTWYQFLKTMSSEQEIYQEICRIVLQSGEYKLVWFGKRTDEDQLVPMAHAGQDDGYLALVSQALAEGIRSESPDVRALISGTVSVSQDIQDDETFGPLRTEAVQRSLLATAAIPLKDSHQKIFGALNVYTAQPNAFDDQKVEWLTLLTNNLITSLQSVLPDVTADDEPSLPTDP